MSRGALGAVVGLGWVCLMGSVSSASAQRLAVSQALRVESRVVTVSYFRHWLRVALRGTVRGHVTDTQARVFDDCAARMALPESAARRRDAVGVRCLRRYRAAQANAVQFLVQAAWFDLEARDRGIRLTAAQVRAKFLRTRRLAFKTPAAYRAFLHDTAMTERDLLKRMRVDMLSERLRTSVPPDQLAESVAALWAKWKPRTVCASRFFSADVCGQRG